MLRIILGVLLVYLACSSRLCCAQELNESEYQSYLAHISAANSALRLNEAVEAKHWLKATPGSHDTWEWRYLQQAVDSSAGVLAAENWSPVKIEYSPDGERLGVAGDDGLARIISIRTRTIEQEIKVGEQAVYAVRFSPDGNSIATTTRDGNLAVWTLANGKKVWEQKSGGQGLADVAFSPDGKQVAFCSWYRGPKTVLGIVSLWNAESGEQIWKTDFGVKPIVTIQFSPDGKRLAAGTWDAIVGVWNTADLSKPTELNFRDVAQYSAIDDIAFDPTGNRLIAASKNGKPRIWDLEKNEIEKDLREHTNAVFAARFSLDGKTIVTGGSDGVVAIWDALELSLKKKHYGHEGRVVSVAIHPQSHSIASCSADKTIRFWSLEDNGTFTDPLGAKFVYGLTLSQDGKLLATGGQTPAEVTIWDMTTMKPLRHLSGIEGTVNYLAFGDQHRLVGGNWNNEVVIWDAYSGKQLMQLEKAEFGGLQQCAFSADGKTVAVSGAKNRTVIWDANSGKKLKELAFPKGCWGICFSRDAKQLAIGDGAGVVHLISCETWEEVKSFSGSDSQIYGLKFSPDGKQLACGSENGRLVFHEIESGKSTVQVTAHSQRIWTVDYAADGTRLATGSADLKVKIWDTRSGANVLTLADFANSIYNVEFSRLSDDLIINELSSGLRIIQLPSSSR